MLLRDLLRDTVQTLSAHKLRTALTMFGIAWGIVSITLMVAAGEGLRVGQAKVAEQFGKDIMIVFAGRTSLQAGGTRAGRALQWRAEDHATVQAQSPDCQWIMPELGRGGVPVRSLYNNAALLVTGSLPPFRSEEHTSELQSQFHLVCRLLLEKKKSNLSSVFRYNKKKHYAELTT